MEVSKKMPKEKVFSPEAIEIMAERLSTPLQINSYAWKALVQAHQIGCRPVSGEIMDAVISPDLEGLEAKAQRSGYNSKSLGEALDAKPNEIKALFHNRLQSPRLQELHQGLLKIGLA